MNIDYIKRVKEAKRELIENTLNYLDISNYYHIEESIRQKVLSREAVRVCEKYKKILPLIIFVEELYNFKKIDITKINPEYILLKYEYLLKDKTHSFCLDGELLIDTCTQIIKLNNEYKGVTELEINKAYNIMFKERIREDKNKIKAALKIKTNRQA